MDDWTAPKILDLAPDAASRKAGQALGRAAAWVSRALRCQLTPFRRRAIHPITPALHNFACSFRCSPAMAASVTDRLWSMEEILALVDAAELAGKRRLYKKRAAM